MTLRKPTRAHAPTVTKTSKQRRFDALYQSERQHLAEVRATLPPEDRAQLDVVYAQINLENRRNGHAQAVIHCPIGKRLLHTECHNNTQRAWYFLTDADTGEVWCIFILASTHYLNRIDASTSNDTEATDCTRVLADTVVRHAHNQRADLDLTERVQAHLMARRPLKVFRRCAANEMEAIGYGRAAGEDCAFVQITTYPSVAALSKVYPMLAKPRNARRLQDAVGHPQVRFDLVVRTRQWLQEDDSASAQATPVATPTRTAPANWSDWSTLLAMVSAAK